MPQTSKRKAQTVKLPTLEQDAAERKRVLNILAQRRYRERRRQRYQELESKVSGQSRSVSTSSPASDSNDDGGVALETSNRDIGSGILNHDFDFPMYLSDNISDHWDTNVLFPSLSSSGGASRTSMSSPSYIGNESLNTTLPSVEGLTFPDEAHLPMLELNILRAGVEIAQRLDVESLIWDLESLSPFNQSPNFNYDHLPINLRPTAMQLTIPHHPMLDILPWPEVRDKLIFVFSQPANLRPPTARSPTAMIGFVYDLEDSAEGIRVTGNDPYACDNWELGQKVFSKWWWAFTKEIIDHSNAVRKARGATALTGMVLGEVS